MNKFTHFILTRFNTASPKDGIALYDKPDPDKWMDERMELFRETKKSVLSQEGDFMWFIALDERTPARYVNEIFGQGYSSKIVRIFEDPRTFFNNREFKNTPWVITSRLDCDDTYKPGAILAIQSLFEPRIKVIDIHYEQVKDGERFTSGNFKKGERYRKYNNGPFLSLVEPSNRIKTCYCRPHSVLENGYPSEDGLVEIPSCKVDKRGGKPYANMVIHDNNIANHITGYKI